MVKVIYIMSSGRSGSTIMNTVLGNHPQMFACGELCHLAHPFVKKTLCSCGAPIPDCPIWNEVYTSLERSGGTNFLSDYLSLQQYFEIYRTPYDKVENALTRFILQNKRLRGIAASDEQRFREYTQMTQLVHHNIQEISKKTIIVDSSKYIARAYWLSHMPDIELYVLHMVRDGRNVVAATKKTLLNEDEKIGWNVQPKPVWRTSIAWAKTNLMIDHHLKQYPYNVLSVQYDDFAQDPIHTLNRINAWLDVDMSPLIDSINHQVVLPVQHVLAGNAGRMRPVTKITYDNKWEKNLTNIEKRLFYIIGGHINRKHGFF